MQNESSTKKFDFSFPRQITVAFVVVAALAAYPLIAFAPADVIQACIAGAMLSLANVLAGYVAIEYSFDKSYTTFLKAVLGGMGVRLLVMLAGILILTEVFHFHVTPLIVSLFGFYMLYLILEVLFIQKKMNRKIQG